MATLAELYYGDVRVANMMQPQAQTQPEPEVRPEPERERQRYSQSLYSDDGHETTHRIIDTNGPTGFYGGVQVNGARDAETSSFSPISDFNENDIDSYNDLKPLQSGHIRPWVPVTLRRWFLVMMIAITIGFLIAAETLRNVSLRNQGLAFATPGGDLSATVQFAAFNLPTIASVLFGLLWNWVDVDVKRMEPFFQLGKESGELAKNSILLTYTTDFLPTVPIAAFKRRHWTVLYSSVAVVLMFWFITPLQNAFIAIRTIQVHENMPFSHSVDFGPVADFEQRVSSKFAFDSYNIAWLGQQLNPFTTNSSGFAHIVPKSSSRYSARPNETWTSMSIEYTTDLSCEPAKISSDKPNEYAINGNCRFQGVGQTPFYAGYAPSLSENFDDPATLFGDNCTFPDGSYFGAYLPPGPNSGAIAAFCRTRYTSQTVKLSTDPKGKILNIERIGQPQPLNATLFNIPLYEQIVSFRQAPYNSEFFTYPFPQPPALALSQMPGFPTAAPPPLLSYGIALADGNISNIRTVQDVQNVFKSVHQLLFSAMITNLQDEVAKTAQSVSSDGTTTYETKSLSVVQPLAILLEVLLVMLLALAIVLAFRYWRLQSPVASDPASIASLMSLVSGSSRLQAKFNEARFQSWDDLKSFLETDGTYYKLGFWPGDGAFRLDVVASHWKHSSELRPIAEKSTTLGDIRRNHSSRFNPFKLGPAMGGLLLFTLIAIMSTLAALFSQNRRPEALSAVTTDKVAFQILFNYLPTAIATFLGPCFVYINRSLCILQPLLSMKSQPTSSAKSLSLRYLSYPPAFSLFESVKARHFVLAAVCLLSLMSEVLSVALGGLFNPVDLPVARPRVIANDFRLQLRGENLVRTESRFAANATSTTPSTTTAYDYPWSFAANNAALYKSGAAVSKSVPFPPWTTDGKLFLPFGNTQQNNATQILQSRTAGIKSGLNCLPLTPANMTGGLQFPVGYNDTTFSNKVLFNITFNASFLEPGKSSCNTFGTLQTLGNGSLTGEFFRNAKGCDESLIVGAWIRAHGLTSPPFLALDHAALGPAVPSQISNASFMAMACMPHIFTADFDVVADGTGHILGYKRKTEWSADTLPVKNGSLESLFESVSTGYLFELGQHFVRVEEYLISLHNDGLPKDWTTYIMSQVDNTTDLLDPSAALPSFSDAAAKFSDVYGYLMASALAENVTALFQNEKHNSTGFEITISPRVKMDNAFFAIIICIIVFSMLIISYVFFVVLRGQLPDMPTSIASTIFLVVHSNALEDAQQTSHMKQRDRNQVLHNLDGRYGLRRVESDVERRWEVYRT